MIDTTAGVLSWIGYLIVPAMIVGIAVWVVVDNSRKKKSQEHLRELRENERESE